MTTPYITERTIEATLVRLNAASLTEAAALQKRSGRLQPELTAFVVSFTLDLRPDAAGLALYVMLVVYEAFRVSCVKLRKAKETTILRRWHATRAHATELRASSLHPTGLLSQIRATSEPVAIGYVVAALAEDSEPDSVHLTDDEFWHLYAVLKTVVEALHDGVAAPRMP